MTGELKKKCITVLQAVVKDFQERKAQISDDLVAQFMDKTRKIDATPRVSSVPATANTTVGSVKEAAEALSS